MFLFGVGCRSFVFGGVRQGRDHGLLSLLCRFFAGISSAQCRFYSFLQAIHITAQILTFFEGISWYSAACTHDWKCRQKGTCYFYSFKENKDDYFSSMSMASSESSPFVDSVLV